MKITGILKTTFGLALVTLIVITAGCIVDPKEAIDENPGPVVEWPDRTNKEDCIKIIERVYNDRNIEKYKELLLKPGELEEELLASGYIWYNQPDDKEKYGVSLNYEDDCGGTAGILEKGVSLELELIDAAGSSFNHWTKVTDIRGVLGNNFWFKQRNYQYTFVLPVIDPEDPYFGEDKTYRGDFNVEFFIGPDPDDPNKYVIYQARDVPKGAE